MCAWLVLSVLFCCAHAVHAAPPKQATADLPAPRPRDEAFRRGVTLGPLVAPESPEAFKRVQAQRLSRAVALGATDVRLLVRWTQTQLDAVELAPFDSIDDELLGWLIAAARSRKLRVWLVPTVAVESPDGERPAGSVAPTSWDRWWWSYRRFVLHYAQVAALRKVPLLAVGNGLTSTEADAERWRALIRDVRKRYQGELTYVASSDSFAKVGFWHDLDLVGVALAPGAASSDAALAPLPARIEQTEPTREFVVCEAEHGVDEPDAGDVLRARQAVYERFADAPKLGGVFVNDIEPTSSPKGKKKVPLSPEAEVIRHWFLGSKH
ncbi:MAG: hypothetical protein ABW252_06035 [Polyangiales bacterium]